MDTEVEQRGPDVGLRALRAETRTHTVFTVRPADHEAGDLDREAWRARHANETVGIAGAYFDTYDDGAAIRSSEGTYRVHVVASVNLDTVRSMLADHEGMTIISEDQEPGSGLLSLLAAALPSGTTREVAIMRSTNPLYFAAFVIVAAAVFIVLPIMLTHGH